MKLVDRLPLRARLFLLVSALVLGVLVSSAVGFFLIEEHLEGLEVRTFLQQEAARIRLRLDNGSEPDIASGVKSFHGDTVPAELADLAAGDYVEVTMAGRRHDVLVEPWRDGLLYVALPENEIEQLEVSLFVLFASWVILLTAVAMFLAYRMSARLVGPVADLARRVESLSPTDRGVRLAADFRGEEVERIARALDSYQERLEGFVEREQSFTSSTSHELRTPLAVIGGAAEILADTLPRDPAFAAQHKAIERIRRATAEMGQFINALLMLSRSGDTDAWRAETDVAAILRRACSDARELAQTDVQLACHCDRELPVAAPPALVQIVVSNLLSNALRHARDRTVTVTCGDAELTVTDEGEGMAPDVLDHVFERHFSGSGGGEGIGLYLVKRICDQFGWRIDVSSRPGAGTSFRVRFRAD